MGFYKLLSYFCQLKANELGSIFNGPTILSFSKSHRDNKSCIQKIASRNLSDALFQCLAHIMDHGEKSTIDHGSYTGQMRLELDFVIVQTATQKLARFSQIFPQVLGIPNPVAGGYLEGYLLHLYDYVWKLAELRLHRNRMPEGSK